MRGAIWTYLFDGGFMPHGYCLLWDPFLFWAHAGSDALIALSYFSIPLVLVVFALRRREFEFRWVLFLFGAFIVCCGLTHILGIWTLWVGSYGIEAVVKLVTALTSVATAIVLWPLIPRVLAMPGTAELERRNQAMTQEVLRHQRTQSELAVLNRELEDRVAARTADLAAKNEQLAGAIRRAEEANEAKGRFLAMMSHEIRTPLNAVINMADLMIETERGGADRGYLSAIATSSKGLLGIVEDILDLSRIEAGRIRIAPVATAIEEIVEEVVQSVAPLAHRKGLDIASTIGSDVPETVMIDPARVRQILLNLVGNAVRYTRSGWVHVDVDLVRQDDGDLLVLDVADTGIGIAQADRERVFERFTQVGEMADGRAGSTGLGLTISRQLVERMGGAINLRSVVGQGSAFRITLPVAAPGPAVSPHSDDQIAVLGPPSRTQQSFAATLVKIGAGLRRIEHIDEPGAADLPRVATALVVMPVQGWDAATVRDWCRFAQRLCPNVTLFVPLGAANKNLAAQLPDHVRLETYPASRDRLVSCLSDSAGPGAGQAAGDAPDWLAGLRVLVVDDNEENRLVAARGLERAGATVRTAGDGETAIAAAAADGFDLILLDLRMPGLDGFATARGLRALDGAAGRVPILAVSASITTETLDRIAAAGMDGHLAKPFRPHDLRAAAARYLKRGPDPAPVAPAAGSPPSAVLDLEVVSEALEHTDPQTMRHILDGFLDRAAGRLESIEAAATPPERADAIHRLSGAAGTLGLSELTGLCVAAEEHLRSGGSKVDLAAIRAATDRAMAALRRYRAEALDG
ncbi:MAG: ATP-binding protein [Sneathiellaceae bacterium]